MFSADLKPVSSGSSLPSVPASALLELKPHDEAGYLLKPSREPKQTPSFGGYVTINGLPQSGAYQVTLSSEAWIDVIQDGKSLTSSAHTGQRDCPGIRKSVRFDLKQGPVSVQLSGAAANTIKLAVLPAE